MLGYLLSNDLPLAWREIDDSPDGPFMSGRFLRSRHSYMIHETPEKSISDMGNHVIDRIGHQIRHSYVLGAGLPLKLGRAHPPARSLALDTDSYSAIQERDDIGRTRAAKPYE